MQNRAAASVFALIGGLALGTVGTFGHRGVIGVGPVDLPWGIVVSVAGVLCFLVGLRVYTGDRLVTLLGALGVIAPVLLFSMEGPGGSVVVVADTLGRVWDLTPLIVAVAVLVWPKRAARPRPADSLN
ncbi:MAG: hypothetical protein FWD85_02170 [Microbacteriaceae bacterium]|nr:hypothetical protein [Microbacteriaceae bacterium]MCL2794096.1 hypothetical protein [Microbacteriaceae bacterium]